MIVVLARRRSRKLTRSVEAVTKQGQREGRVRFPQSRKLSSFCIVCIGVRQERCPTACRFLNSDCDHGHRFVPHTLVSIKRSLLPIFQYFAIGVMLSSNAFYFKTNPNRKKKNPRIRTDRNAVGCRPWWASAMLTLGAVKEA